MPNRGIKREREAPEPESDHKRPNFVTTGSSGDASQHRHQASPEDDRTQMACSPTTAAAAAEEEGPPLSDTLELYQDAAQQAHEQSATRGAEAAAANLSPIASDPHASDQIPAAAVPDSGATSMEPTRVATNPIEPTVTPVAADAQRLSSSQAGHQTCAKHANICAPAAATEQCHTQTQTVSCHIISPSASTKLPVTIDTHGAAQRASTQDTADVTIASCAGVSGQKQSIWPGVTHANRSSIAYPAVGSSSPTTVTTGQTPAPAPFVAAAAGARWKAGQPTAVDSQMFDKGHLSLATQQDAAAAAANPKVNPALTKSTNMRDRGCRQSEQAMLPVGGSRTVASLSPAVTCASPGVASACPAVAFPDAAMASPSPVVGSQSPASVAPSQREPPPRQPWQWMARNPSGLGAGYANLWHHGARAMHGSNIAEGCTSMANAGDQLSDRQLAAQVTRILNMNLNQRFGSHAKAFDGVPAVAGPTVGQAASKAQLPAVSSQVTMVALKQKLAASQADLEASQKARAAIKRTLSNRTSGLVKLTKLVKTERRTAKATQQRLEADVKGLHKQVRDKEQQLQLPQKVMDDESVKATACQNRLSNDLKRLTHQLPNRAALQAAPTDNVARLHTQLYDEKARSDVIKQELIRQIQELKVKRGETLHQAEFLATAEDIAHLQQQLHDSRTKAKAAASASSVTEHRLMSEAADLRQQLQRFQRQATASAEIESDLRRQLQTAQSQAEQQRSSSTELAASLHKAFMDEQTKAASTEAALTQQISDLQQKLQLQRADAEQHTAQYMKQISGLNQELDESESRAADMETAQAADRKELMEKLTQQQAEAATTQTKLSEQVKAHVTKLEQLSQKLKHQQEDAARTSQKLTEQVTQLEQKLVDDTEELEQKLADETEEVTRMQEKLITGQALILEVQAAFQQEAAVLSQKLEEELKATQAAKSSLTTKTQEAQRLRKTLLELQQNCKVKVENVEKQRAKDGIAVEQLERCKQRNSDQAKQISVLEQKLAAAQAKKCNRSARLQRRIDSLKHAVGERDTAVGKYQHLVERFRKDETQLKKQRADLLEEDCKLRDDKFALELNMP